MCESNEFVRRTPNAHALSTASDDEPTCTVATWDHQSGQWQARERRATKWDLRRWLRALYAESWDHVSILVERND